MAHQSLHRFKWYSLLLKFSKSWGIMIVTFCSRSNAAPDHLMLFGVIVSLLIHLKTLNHWNAITSFDRLWWIFILNWLKNILLTCKFKCPRHLSKWVFMKHNLIILTLIVWSFWMQLVSGGHNVPSTSRSSQNTENTIYFIFWKFSLN